MYSEKLSSVHPDLERKAFILPAIVGLSAYLHSSGALKRLQKHIQNSKLSREAKSRLYKVLLHAHEVRMESADLMQALRDNGMSDLKGRDLKNVNLAIEQFYIDILSDRIDSVLSKRYPKSMNFSGFLGSAAVFSIFEKGPKKGFFRTEVLTIYIEHGENLGPGAVQVTLRFNGVSRKDRIQVFPLNDKTFKKGMSRIIEAVEKAQAV